MDDARENRDEQHGDGALQAGVSETLGNRDTESVADGESRIERLNLGEVAEGGILRDELAVVLSEENAARKAGKGAVLSLNGLTDGEKGELQPTIRDLQSTMKLGDAVEEDARAVARSLTTLLASLKSALSEVTGSSVEHMRTENEAAGHVQDAAIDAATKGNRFINACLRLNEEMKGMNNVAGQLDSLKHRVDQFEHQSNRYLSRY